MPDNEMLAQRFEEQRGRLRAVAYRILGSFDEAEDAVQEAWLRLGRADAEEIENLAGWLTTVTARICLDLLRTRKPQGAAPEADLSALNPEREALLADAVGLALLRVLDRLSAAERVAFVLHDMFDLPFEEIAAIVERSPEAARQLASRARRRVRGGGEADQGSQEQRARLVEGFRVAARTGDLGALLALLDPDAVLRCDAAAVAGSRAATAAGAPHLEAEIRGARAIAETFRGRAAAARPARLDGAPGLVWAPGGQVRAAFVFEIAEGRIRGIELVADPASLAEMEIAIG